MTIDQNSNVTSPTELMRQGNYRYWNQLLWIGEQSINSKLRSLIRSEKVVINYCYVTGDKGVGTFGRNP